jgi:hypothetical protein
MLFIVSFTCGFFLSRKTDRKPTLLSFKNPYKKSLKTKELHEYYFVEWKNECRKTDKTTL